MNTFKILVTSQKGGIGKSTIAANIAAYFASVAGKRTMLIDFDHQGTPVPGCEEYRCPAYN